MGQGGVSWDRKSGLVFGPARFCEEKRLIQSRNRDCRRAYCFFGCQRPGMIKVRPATMVSLLSPFNSLMASTVVLNFREIPQRESPV